MQHSTEQGPHLEPSSPHPPASQIQLQPRAPPVPLRTSHGRREAQQEKETGKQCQEREQVSVMSRGAAAAPSRAVSEARPDRDGGKCPCHSSGGARWALGSFPPKPLHNPTLRMFPSCAPWAPALLSAGKSFTHPKKGAKQPLQGRMSSRFPECSGCDSAPQNLSPGVKIRDDSALVPDFTGITGWPWHTSHTWGQPRASGHVSPASRGQEQQSRRRFLLIPALPPGAGSGLSLHPELQTHRGHGLGARFPSKMHREGQRLQESPSPSSAPLQESQR